MGGAPHFRRETFQNDGSRTHIRRHHGAPVRSKVREPLIDVSTTASQTCLKSNQPMSSIRRSENHKLNTYPKIRQPLSLLHPPIHPLLPSNHLIPIAIEDSPRNLDNITFPAVINILCRLVIKPICASNLLRGPDAVIVEVMERKEGGRIKVRDVVLFWS